MPNQTAMLDEPNIPGQSASNKGSSIGPARAAVAFSIDGDPVPALVEVSRQLLQLTGTKLARDRGASSGCTARIDANVVASCGTFALDARDKEITAIEGPARNGHLHPVQLSFGFCTPGMATRRASLINEDPHSGLTGMTRAISGHRSRSGTYNNIFKTVLPAARGA